MEKMRERHCVFARKRADVEFTCNARKCADFSCHYDRRPKSGGDQKISEGDKYLKVKNERKRKRPKGDNPSFSRGSKGCWIP